MLSSRPSPFERAASFSFGQPQREPLEHAEPAAQMWGRQAAPGERQGGGEPCSSPAGAGSAGGCCRMDTDSPAPSGSCGLWGSSGDCGAAALPVSYPCAVH